MELTKRLFLFAVFASALVAAPQLRLSTTTAGPYPVAPGGSAVTRSIDAYNVGDGTLNLTATSSAPWLTPSVGSARPCTQPAGRTCYAINFALNMGTRAAGLYTAVVTVTDPQALDAPQEVIVTASVGSAVPDQIDIVLPTTGTTTTTTKRITLADAVNVNTTTTSGGSWLTAALEGAGTLRFTFPYLVRATRGALGEGVYNGRLTISNSPFAGDNKAVAVNLRVTGLGVLEVAPERVFIRVVRGSSAAAGVTFVNRGGQTVTGSTSGSLDIPNGGPRLNFSISNNAGTITADAANATAGSYETTLDLNPGNAIPNQTLRVPVSVTVLEPFAARAAVGGAVNNATFETGDAVARGAIAAVFGERLVLGTAATAGAVPLPTQLGTNNTRVLLNGNALPLYYVSDNQINFQVPYDAPLGVQELRVERGGEVGSRIAIEIVDRAARMLRLGIEDFGIVQNPADNTLALPPGVLPEAATRPARAGDVIVIYAIGLGQTNPAVTTGQAAPTGPLAVVPGNLRIRFGSGFAGGTQVIPDFVGLSPGFVGLYQINVRIPAGISGSRVPVTLVGLTGGDSNTISVAVQ